jgi:CxxC motif-containing protein
LIVLQENLLQMIFNPSAKPKVFNPRKVQKFCHDCGSRLGFYPSLSNTKAENQFRVLTYVCMNCTEDSDKPHLIRVSRNEVQDPLKVVNIEIKHAKKKFKPRALSPKTRKKLEKKYDEEIKAELDSGNIERAEKLKNMTVQNSLRFG